MRRMPAFCLALSTIPLPNRRILTIKYNATVALPDCDLLHQRVHVEPHLIAVNARRWQILGLHGRPKLPRIHCEPNQMRGLGAVPLPHGAVRRDKGESSDRAVDWRDQGAPLIKEACHDGEGVPFLYREVDAMHSRSFVKKVSQPGRWNSPPRGWAKSWAPHGRRSTSYKQ